MIYARQAQSYRFSIPPENTVSDSIAVMSEQIFQDLNAQGRAAEVAEPIASHRSPFCPMSM